jgi:hypothetical protein
MPLAVMHVPLYHLQTENAPIFLPSRPIMVLNGTRDRATTFALSGARRCRGWLLVERVKPYVQIGGERDPGGIGPEQDG